MAINHYTVPMIRLIWFIHRVLLASMIALIFTANVLADEKLDEIDDPWMRSVHIRAFTDDLDGMLERGFIRLLTVPNRTHYFVDGARERGVVADAAKDLEKHLNAQIDSKRWINMITIPIREAGHLGRNRLIKRTITMILMPNMRLSRCISGRWAATFWMVVTKLEELGNCSRNKCRS